jgi:hypothetical protein
MGVVLRLGGREHLVAGPQLLLVGLRVVLLKTHGYRPIPVDAGGASDYPRERGRRSQLPFVTRHQVVTLNALTSKVCPPP